MGTLAPVCSLAFWKPDGGGYDQSSIIDTTTELSDNLEALETADHLLDGVDAGDASPEGGSWWFPTLLFGMDYSDQLSINILPSLH
eukprot:scaffold18294_cov58-Skeletonema_marinoi.AAC.1